MLVLFGTLRRLVSQEDNTKLLPCTYNWKMVEIYGHAYFLYNKNLKSNIFFHYLILYKSHTTKDIGKKILRKWYFQGMTSLLYN